MRTTRRITKLRSLGVRRAPLFLPGTPPILLVVTFQPSQEDSDVQLVHSFNQHLLRNYQVSRGLQPHSPPFPWAAPACHASSHRIFKTPHKPATGRGHRLQQETEARRGSCPCLTPQPQWTSWHLSADTLALEFGAGQTAAEHSRCLS